MFRNFCLIIALFVASQATADTLFVEDQATAKEITWRDLISHKKDLTPYFNGGFQATSIKGAAPLDSLNKKWAWGRPGVQFEFGNLRSGNVLTFLAEMEVADSSLTSLYLEQQLRFPSGNTYRLRMGHIVNPLLNMEPTPVQRTTLGAPEAFRGFHRYFPGGMFAVDKQMPRGKVLVEVALFERSKAPDYDDPIFVRFQDLEYGENVHRFASHVAFKHDSLKLEAGFEQEVGHSLAISGDFSGFSGYLPRTQLKLGMSSFRRQSELAPLDFFFVENAIWVTPVIALTGRLDFGDEVEEVSQIGAIWKHHGQAKDGLFGFFYHPSAGVYSVILSGGIER